MTSPISIASFHPPRNPAKVGMPMSSAPSQGREPRSKVTELESTSPSDSKCVLTHCVSWGGGLCGEEGYGAPSDSSKSSSPLPGYGIKEPCKIPSHKPGSMVFRNVWCELRT